MKVQVNVSDELVKQIDDYAALMGISRSSLCAIFIGQGILAYNKSFKMIDDIGQKLGDSLIVENTIKEVSKEVSKDEKKQ